MLFNSYIFILLFLPLALAAYYFFKYKNNDVLAKVSLVLMSLWFYSYFHLSYILVILTSIAVNFIVSKQMKKATRYKKGLLISGIVMDVGLIFYYKYLDFVLENLNLVTGLNIPLLHILMPLGISFFTFQQIGYLVDVYYDEIEQVDLLDYCLFITFFPQLIAGPIVTYNEMIPQFGAKENSRFSSERFARGLYWFACGLAKKVLIADTLGKGAKWGYANVATLNGPEAILTGVLYTFELYYDFSGYCDMACGIGKMFGVDLPVNFLSPLKSLNVMDFWNRWHITLGRFLTNYVFNPLVRAFGPGKKGMDRASRKKRQEKIGNLCLFLTFFISGIWHGANWTFILWGVLQGTGRVLYQIFRKKYDAWKKGVQWTINFVFNVFSMALFGAPSIKAFGQMLQKIPVGWSQGMREGFLQNFDIMELTYVEDHIGILRSFVQSVPQTNMVLISMIAILIALLGRNIYEQKKTCTVWTAIATVILMVWSILSLSSVSTFLYFNF